MPLPLATAHAAFATASTATSGTTVAPIRNTPDDAEMTRRLVSLISLLGIYAVGLVLVAFLSDGPDIGVLLAALFGHAVFVTARYLVRENLERHTLVSAGSRGISVLSRRARFIRYRDIARTKATDATLTLWLKSEGDLVLQWQSVSREQRDALLGRIFHATRVTETRRPVASRSRESLARLAAAIGELASPNSSAHFPLTG